MKVYWQLIVSPNCSYITDAGLHRIGNMVSDGYTHGGLDSEDGECDVNGNEEVIYFPKKEKVR